MDKIFKKVHEDGSETVIKQVMPASRNPDGQYHERDTLSTSIFVSSSKGCVKKCTFCHLTAMEMKFAKLSVEGIVDNVLQAVGECSFVDRGTPLKVCFMGMGDPNISSSTTELVANSLCSQLVVEEVDVSSVMYSDSDVERYNKLSHRVPTRLFYSIHTGIRARRNIIIPKTDSLHESVLNLLKFKGDKFLHYTPVVGLNDRVRDAESLGRIALRGFGVRMLEFNPAGGSGLERPSRDRLSKLYKVMEGFGVPVKWQVSKGSKELASCGMFTEESKDG